MLTTTNVKSLSSEKGVISLEEISSKVDAGLSFPVVYSESNDGSDGATVIDATYTGGYPDRPMIECKYNNCSLSISPVTMKIHDGTDSISLQGNQIVYYPYGGAANPFLNTGNIKTINGESIYGSGDIDTTPTLKTINSTSLIGSGNVFVKPFEVVSNNELNFVHTGSSGDLFVGYHTLNADGSQRDFQISSYKFVNGAGNGGYVDIYCAKLYTSSDERFKENIKPYEPTVSVLDLSVKEFNYKVSKIKSVGVIAQEVQKLFPDAVSADEKTGYLSVDDRSLMYMLMAEVKKLRDRVDELEGK